VALNGHPIYGSGMQIRFTNVNRKDGLSVRGGEAASREHSFSRGRRRSASPPERSARRSRDRAASPPRWKGTLVIQAPLATAVRCAVCEGAAPSWMPGSLQCTPHASHDGHVPVLRRLAAACVTLQLLPAEKRDDAAFESLLTKMQHFGSTVILTLCESASIVMIHSFRFFGDGDNAVMTREQARRAGLQTYGPSSLVALILPAARPLLPEPPPPLALPPPPPPCERGDEERDADCAEEVVRAMGLAGLRHACLAVREELGSTAPSDARVARLEVELAACEALHAHGCQDWTATMLHVLRKAGAERAAPAVEAELSCMAELGRLDSEKMRAAMRSLCSRTLPPY